MGDSRLSKAEKKLAERSYKLERTSKITYSRPSYAAFYPKPGSGPATNLHNPGSRGITRNRYYEHGKRLDTWLAFSSSETSCKCQAHGVSPAEPHFTREQAGEGLLRG